MSGEFNWSMLQSEFHVLWWFGGGLWPEGDSNDFSECVINRQASASSASGCGY